MSYSVEIPSHSWNADGDASMHTAAGCFNSRSNSDCQSVRACAELWHKEGAPFPPWHLAWWLWPTTPPAI